MTREEILAAAASCFKSFKKFQLILPEDQRRRKRNPGEGGQSMSINEIIMESLEARIREISDAAWSLVKQVDKYTSEAGYRGDLLAANEQLKKVLRE